MEVGSWNKFNSPHCCVVGSRSDFYVYIRKETGSYCSDFIKGKLAGQVWDKLWQCYRKDKVSFIKMAEDVIKKYPKQY